MKLEPEMTDAQVLALLGERVAQLRLAKNLTQEGLAEQAGLGVRTLQRLETGAAATQLSGFIRVCRVLGLLDRLDVLVPASTPSPMAQLKLQGSTRRRASGRPAAARAPKKWTWGDPS